jgi:hypothetical protein
MMDGLRIPGLVTATFIWMIFSIFSSCVREDEVQIFLCIGQSNMAGRAEVLPEDTAALDRVYLFNDNDTWEPAKNPLNQYSTVRKRLSMQRLGPAWSFARRLSEHEPDMHIGLVVNARGGTKIEEWKKGGQLYNEAVIRALKAQKTGRIRAVLWHQGEGDQKNWEIYEERFDSLVYHLRKDLGIPDLPVIVGQIGTWRSSADAINDVLATLGDHIEHVRTATAEGLTHLGDNSHFDTASQIILGERYAEEYITIATSNKSQNPSTK